MSLYIGLLSTPKKISDENRRFKRQFDIIPSSKLIVLCGFLHF